MTKLHSKSKHPIEPSSRDSISSWLDVLTSMLVMSDTQRAQVRDELEDHLRSRVDDLLIIGKSEPESIRIAVAELGETAELAKLITHAHTRSNPRRTRMNIAIMSVAIAGITLGTMNFMPGTAVPVSRQSDTELVKEIALVAEPVHVFDLDNTSIHQVINVIAGAFDRKVVVSEILRDQSFLLAQDQLALSLKGKYTLDQAVYQLEDKLSVGQYRVEISVNDNEIHFQTFEEYKRSLIETRAYPVPIWITSESDTRNYAGTLENLIGMKHDLEYTSIQVVGKVIVIAAPNQIHAEIISINKQLQQIAINSQIETEQKLALERDQQEQRLSRLRQEYESAKTQYKQKFKTASELESQSAYMSLDLSALRRDARQSGVETTDEIHVLQDKMSEIGFQIHGQQLEVDEAKSRFERLQTMLLNAESDLVFADLNQVSQIDLQSNEPRDMNTISIFGQVARHGVFELPSNGSLTLARLLTSANVNNLGSRVFLNRDGEEQELGRVRELMLSDQSKFKLRQGDEFRVTHAN